MGRLRDRLSGAHRRRASDNGRLGTILSIADVVNRLGISATIITVGLVLVVAVAFGKIDNPLASSAQLKVHDDKDNTHHLGIADVHIKSLKLQERSTLVLEKLNCKQERTEAAKNRCLEEMNQ